MSLTMLKMPRTKEDYSTLNHSFSIILSILSACIGANPRVFLFIFPEKMYMLFKALGAVNVDSPFGFVIYEGRRLSFLNEKLRIKGNLIVMNGSQKPREFPHTFIHELLHIFYPKKKEKEIQMLTESVFNGLFHSC